MYCRLRRAVVRQRYNGYRCFLVWYVKPFSPNAYPLPDPVRPDCRHRHCPGRGGSGGAGVGADIAPLAQAILGRVPEPRHATFSRFVDDEGGVIDEGIALYFAAPHSFTGEHVLELQGHGGPVVLNLILQRCVELGAPRWPKPASFPRRAFLNGKLDLAQAEAVADLIDAASTEAARSAVRSLSASSRADRELVEALTRLRMLVEATLDFPEEEIDFLRDADAFGRLDAHRHPPRRGADAGETGRHAA